MFFLTNGIILISLVFQKITPSLTPPQTKAMNYMHLFWTIDYQYWATDFQVSLQIQDKRLYGRWLSCFHNKPPLTIDMLSGQKKKKVHKEKTLSLLLSSAPSSWQSLKPLLIINLKALLLSTCQRIVLF